MNRRVLMIANTPWFLQNFCEGLVARLESKGYDVTLAAPAGEETTSDFFTRREFVPLRLSRQGRNPITELISLYQFYRLLRHTRPVATMTWTSKPNIYAGICGRILGVPVIPNVSGLGVVFIRRGLLSSLVGLLYRRAFARSPVVYLLNERDRETFVESRWVTPDRAELLPGTGVDLRKFSLEPLTPVEPMVFLYVGRLLADKGLRELVTAVGQLRNSGRSLELRVAGFVDPGNPSGISKEELDSWIEEGLVNYIGPLQDVRPTLGGAHCVVLPSYREGLPRSLLEAAATGRPIITTDAPGCREVVVPEESGFLCEPRSAESLASCMERMLDLSPEALQEMGRAGRAHVEQHFSEEIVLDAYLRQCDALIVSGCAVRTAN